MLSAICGIKRGTRDSFPTRPKGQNKVTLLLTGLYMVYPVHR